jgi:hypothetical protein
MARTLWTGSLPVGRREEYMGTTVDHAATPGFAAGQLQSMSSQPPSPVSTVKLARVTQFQMEVAEPWKTLIRSSFKAAESMVPNREIQSQGDQTQINERRVLDFNLQQQTVSWLILLDFADYIEAYLSDLWTVIQNGGAGANALPDLRRQIHTWLAGMTMSADLISGLRLPGSTLNIKTPMPTMRDALKAIKQAGVRDRLEAAILNYDSSNTADLAWPPFHFVLAGMSLPNYLPDGPFQNLLTLNTPPSPFDPQVGPAPEAQPGPASLPLTPSQQVLEDARIAAEKIDWLTSLVGRALDTTGDAAAPPLPYALKLKNALNSSANDPGRFVIRFVYGRRDCGPLHPPLVSAATEAFQLASFFDSDAPARPIRISLPLDVSAAGLRKFNKNTAFVMSDMLCGQVQRAKGLGLVDLVLSVLPWPFHKSLDVGAGGPCQNSSGNIGMICSLSIPIITICALILLMIIVSLLDMIFRWMPYFVMCFPIPGLKGKKGSP